MITHPSISKTLIERSNERYNQSRKHPSTTRWREKGKTTIAEEEHRPTFKRCFEKELFIRFTVRVFLNVYQFLFVFFFPFGFEVGCLFWLFYFITLTFYLLFWWYSPVTSSRRLAQIITCFCYRMLSNRDKCDFILKSGKVSGNRVAVRSQPGCGRDTIALFSLPLSFRRV